MFDVVVSKRFICFVFEVWFSAKTALNCIIVHGFLHLCFSARYLLVILHVFQPRSCRNCSVQKLGCLRHLLVHPSATKIVFHLPRLKLPRLKFLLTARGSCLYCCPHPWFSVIYHFPLLLLRVVLKLHFIWKTWSHTTSADMICSIKASDVVQFLLFSPVGSSKLLFGSWISMYRWVASGYCLQ